jgi:CheY-like chemotaxis protein
MSHRERACIVLYVEDEPVNVMLMQAIFARRPGYRLVVARDGASALALAPRVAPDLLMLDIGLPDCRGDELLRELRRLPVCADVPAMAVTADATFDAKKNGFDDLWSKPLYIDRLLDDIDRCLDQGARLERHHAPGVIAG